MFPFRVSPPNEAIGNGSISVILDSATSCWRVSPPGFFKQD
jgi:hypothetical protein